MCITSGKHAARTSICDTHLSGKCGSRNLAGNKNDSYDDLDFLYDIRPEETDDDYLLARRRVKERAAAAFEEDLAEIRRKRRDMEVVKPTIHPPKCQEFDRLFDVLDVNKEIEKAKSKLEKADSVFSRHGLKFDNTDDVEQDMSLAQKLTRRKKLETLDIPGPEKPRQGGKWAKLVPLDLTDATETSANLRSKLDSIIADSVHAEIPGDAKKRGSLLNRKKSVSF